MRTKNRPTSIIIRYIYIYIFISHIVVAIASMHGLHIIVPSHAQLNTICMAIITVSGN